MKEKSYIKLLDEARAGDLKAWTSLQNRFSNYALYFATKIVKDSDLAQDVAQESFWEIFRNLNKITTSAGFPNLLRKVIMKQSDRILRKKDSKNLPFSEVNLKDKSSKEIHSALVEKDSIDIVIEKVKKLNSIDQNIIELHYYKNLTLNEIAESKGKTLSFVKKRHLQLKKTLRIEIGESFRPQASLHLLKAA
ncbi:MAG TPA: sigma-70 family RNA polymerase sigma factor [Leptospiraceae bacterium]|nr:sigma-70 family RNA polymerase sigma factor [Leptospiraceae bacterium]HMW08706.1 sigma-70 family RNA polymerase sigma factor [Leptospiraceae bacterium]HMX35128.1 sigma-70 family RNA polymerase sigma factor [Leptospiraceae bacterium]HMY34420.1 sigma-70 family RNA polymerase sigma factor [Leptospiraceae bacterium]HMZ66843.1 sigma-70 family RNA polymerase sigma factor [Leptospiraceae bacterium]